jgi:YceI-like domain
MTGISYGQKYRSEKGLITFFSDGAIEDTSAENTVAGSLFNAMTGELVFIVPIKDFKFQKSLMREHFNEKYMETERYPKSTFLGKLTGFSITATGEQKVKAIGKLTLHGVTRDVIIPGVADVANGKVTMKSKFILKLKDYNVEIPTIVWKNIAEEIELKIDFIYKTI